MPSFNQITIVGHLGKDPEGRYTPQGVAVTDFTIATNHHREEPPTWFKVTCWRQTAENVVKYLKKGSTAYVTGVLHLEEWQGRDGKKGVTLCVTASDVKFLGGRPDEQIKAVAAVQADQAFTGTPQGFGVAATVVDDDIAF